MGRDLGFIFKSLIDDRKGAKRGYVSYLGRGIFPLAVESVNIIPVNFHFLPGFTDYTRIYNRLVNTWSIDKVFICLSACFFKLM